MKRELHIFFTCLMFYTRIPCPKILEYDPEYLNKATRYFPLIGWIVGSITFVAFYLFSQFLSLDTAVIIAMIVSVLTTGAFHEDGFADVCDGFGGGWTKERILIIMKDSAIGAYGAVGIILLFLLKYNLLSEVIFKTDILYTQNLIPLFLVFISAQALSRFAAITIMFTYDYSRDDASSKSKPIAKAYSWREVVGSTVFGLAPLLTLAAYKIEILFTLLPVFTARTLLARYFQKWIDGYTGDCLGATQQVCEVVYYLALLMVWSFI